MTEVLRALAPGKTNLCLFLGPTRPDGLHELVSVIEPLSLADELTLEPLEGGALVAAGPPLAGETCAAGADEVVCAGVEGPNLAAAALARYRAATGWEGPPRRLTIVKRVPVAAGMGGGSGDAAATLRLAAHAAGRPGDPAIAALAPQLGADVPSQVEPRPVLVHGAGEHVESFAPPPPHGVLVLPSRERLSTPDVFREADRLGIGRDAGELAALRERLRDGLAPALIANDLQDAARSLCPAIDDALAAARDAGAEQALVSGSGPTVVGLFWGADGEERAAAAAAALSGRFPGAVAARPVGPDFAAVVGVRDNGGSS
ncbi:4-(cytidine 5'-diphospho)-2-C-methyl-D-erythritol kinase [Conexibacter arvalis]|uniref:4-diphosphocytidyl-2-C-methyl-D-erythritol kinase n=1 Tax=Conexibacter arvalis TaxID=912552 RepID=A0A840ICD2_9ACTN|nr:4-(cytidine 5'-diphospho)-2-C-methyl-D-erythritol kinase [Conexibacter arvalis]MBB4661718.1 4-diphosphocytidyl-2-C-methyl-D-erythritol kinase [Conexibacter arvalis]